MAKKILILGGTFFIGRTLVELLRQQPDLDLTLFVRGNTNSGIFPDIKRIIGNRNQPESLDQLANTTWDAVIDFSCYFPNPLQHLLQRLRGNVGRYIFVSTVSVYDLSEAQGKIITETSPLETCTPDERVDTTMNTYGKRKVACEQALLDMPDMDSIIFRPGVVYGQYDPFDRHYYWLYRLQTQSQLLVPEGIEGSRLSATYAPDFAAMLCQALEISHHNTIYNALTHPIIPLTEMISAMENALNRHPKHIEIPPEKLLSVYEIQPWVDIPLWANADILMCDNSRLIADFAPQLTPLQESFAQTAAYYAQSGWTSPRAGMPMERERYILNHYQQNA